MTINKQDVRRYTDMGSETICPINNMRKSDYGDYVLYEDYEALQAECEKLRTLLAQASEFVFEPDRDCKCQECIDAASLLCAINAATQPTAKEGEIGGTTTV